MRETEKLTRQADEKPTDWTVKRIKEEDKFS
jgi:hypothetical protein